MGVADLPADAGSSTSGSSVAPVGAGWSDRRDHRWAGGDGVQGLPVVGPGPVDREMQVEAAGGGRDPAGDPNDLATQGPTVLGQVGSDRGGANDVERDHCQSDPGSVG